MEDGEIIELTRETISTQDIKKICDEIKKNRVQALTLREIKITDKDYKNLLKHVSTAERLRHLSLSLGVVSDHFRIQLLALCVQRNSSLTGLFIHGNSLFDAGIQALYPSIRCHKRLVCIDVGDSEIGDEGLELLCTLLPPSEHRPGLRELTLTRNPAITDKGWTHLGLTLTNNTTLRSLYIDYNHLNEVSASCLVMAIVTSSAIETLDMECTDMTEATGQLFLQLLDQKPNLNLQSLNILDNSVAQATLDAIMMRFPGDTDLSQKDNDYISDDEHSLATSEPPLHQDVFYDDVDDASDINDTEYRVHPAAARSDCQHEDNYNGESGSSVVVVDVDESALLTPDGTLTPSDYGKPVSSDIAPAAKENISFKGKSLAEKIKLRQLSSDNCQKTVTTGILEETYRSSSVGDIPQVVGSNITDKNNSNTYSDTSSGVKTVNATDGNRRVSVSIAGKTGSDFLIPETPSVVSLHKYQAGLTGQDDGNFEPIDTPAAQRPCSAPLNVTQTNPGSFPENSIQQKIETTKPSSAVRNALFSSTTLQVVDTRRRLSCGSILQTPGNKSKRLSVGNLHKFQRAYSLHTPDNSTQEYFNQETSPSAPGSPEENNIRRRLSSASIHPVRLQKQTSALSADSSSTLGDISLEDVS